MKIEKENMEKIWIQPQKQIIQAENWSHSSELGN